MPNCFFVAKRRWEAEDLAGGARTLNECLERELGGPAFEPHSRVFNSQYFARFDTGVAAMLSDEHMRKTSFGALFAVIWRWHPDQIWIGVSVDFNFFEHFDRFGFDEALVEPLRQLGGFEAIVGTLCDAAVKGLLAPEFEGPNSGRPALPLADIERIKDERWGPLKPVLLKRLKEAYEQCPKDFWARLAANDPEGVLIRFLHDLFGNCPHPMDVAELRWKAITRGHPAYAAAVLTSLEHVPRTRSDDRQWLTDVVRIDAGFTSVEDGSQWLSALLMALRASDFTDLA